MTRPSRSSAVRSRTKSCSRRSERRRSVCSASQPTARRRTAGQTKKPQPPWSRAPWHVSFGEDASRNWEDACEFGFGSAGGGDWHSQTLKKLPQGGRVFVNIPGSGPGCGYVGVGIVTAAAMPVTDFKVPSSTGSSSRLLRLAARPT